MFKRTWHNYSMDSEVDAKALEALERLETLPGSPSRLLNDDNDEEELQLLRATDEEEEEAEEAYVLLQELSAKFKDSKRVSVGGTGISRRNTQMSIVTGGGFSYGPNGFGGGGEELSSDAQSSDDSQPGGAEWNEQQLRSPEMPAEYWQVQRLIKYIKVCWKQLR